jgi:uncharacterized protein
MWLWWPRGIIVIPGLKWTRSGAALAIGALLALASPATAQFSNSYDFLKAVQDKDLSKAYKALSATGNSIVNTRHSDTGDTALHIATKRADTTWIRFLLAAGANPDARDGAGDTPLVQSVVRGCRDCVMLLLENKANPNAQNEAGETPLIKAVQLRNTIMVRTLLDGGAKVDVTDSVTGLTALEHAQRDRRSGQIAQMLRDAAKK